MKYFDLFEPMLIDTYFSVKMDAKFVHYITHANRIDGTQRLWGDVYTYFVERDNFRFALGYILSETSDGFWKGEYQYCYFSKEEPPQEVKKILKSPLFFPKGKQLYRTMWE